MSDSDADELFDSSIGLRLRKSPEFAPKLTAEKNFHSSELKNERENYSFESKFEMKSFLNRPKKDANFHNLGERDENLETKLEGSSQTLDIWNSDALYQNISFSQNKNQNSICVLRLIEILTNMDQVIQKVSMDLVTCEKKIPVEHSANMRNFGYYDGGNLKVLKQTICSLQASTKMLLVETHDFEEHVFRKERINKSNPSYFYNFFLLSLVPAFFLLYHGNGLASKGLEKVVKMLGH